MISARVVLWGSFGHTNLGDDLLLMSFMRILQDEGLDNSEVAIRVRNTGEQKWIKHLFPEVIIIQDDDCVACDKLIFAGGTQFFSFPNGRKGLVRYASIAYNAIKLLGRINFRANKYRNVTFQRAGAFSVGLGPFKSSGIVLLLVRQWIKRLSVIVVRDSKSLDYTSLYGAKGTSFIDKDIVYYRSLWDTSSHDTKIVKHNNQKPLVGLILRDWTRGNVSFDYLDSIINFTKVHRDKYAFQYFIFSEHDTLVMSRLNAENIDYYLWDVSNYKINEYIELIESSDFIISSRAHGTVIADLLETPVVAINIDPKTSLISAIRNSKSSVPSWSDPFEIDVLDVLLREAKANYSKVSSKVMEEGNVVNLLRKFLKS